MAYKAILEIPKKILQYRELEKILPPNTEVYSTIDGDGRIPEGITSWPPKHHWWVKVFSISEEYPLVWIEDGNTIPVIQWPIE